MELTEGQQVSCDPGEYLRTPVNSGAQSHSGFFFRHQVFAEPPPHLSINCQSKYQSVLRINRLFGRCQDGLVYEIAWFSWIHAGVVV